ncbi:MAG: VWA domain-containing protein [Pyrinomonadaceae bacterium]
MRKVASLLLLSLLLFVSTQPALTQETRARRVGQTPATPAPQTAPTTQAPTPNAKSTTTTAPVASGKEILEEVGEGDVVRVNTALVTVPVSVLDRNGRYIPDLGKEDFRLYENGVEQEIAYFATVEKPFTVVLMLDTSSSVWSKLKQIKEAAIKFVDQLRPDDRVMVVTFAHGTTVLSEPTTDRQKLREGINHVGKGLSTHLYDAVDSVMKKRINQISGRKAIVLFTDGVDSTSSRATYESNIHDAEELDAIIYSVQYDTYDGPAGTGAPTPPPSTPPARLPSIFRRFPIPIPIQLPGTGGGGGSSTGSTRADYALAGQYLRELALKTGGRVYQADKNLINLQQAFNNIAEELRRQYSLGYYPNRQAKTEERRRIRVSVERANLAVRARDSYIYKPAPNVNAPNTVTAQDKEQKQQAPSSPPVLQKKPFVADARCCAARSSEQER